MTNGKGGDKPTESPQEVTPPGQATEGAQGGREIIPQADEEPATEQDD